MKFVLDCNILISSAISKNGNCRLIIKNVLVNHQIIVSEPIINEYLDVINRKKFSKYLNYNLAQVKLIMEYAKFTPLSRKKFDIPDIDDLKYIQTALAEKANYLVTGNIKDFPDNTYDGVQIITPKYYVNKLMG